jgi:hypothetical protein
MSEQLYNSGSVVVSMAFSKYINDVVFHLKGPKHVVNGQNKITTKISVVTASIFERYKYSITQQDVPHKDRIIKSRRMRWPGHVARMVVEKKPLLGG